MNRVRLAIAAASIVFAATATAQQPPVKKDKPAAAAKVAEKVAEKPAAKVAEKAAPAKIDSAKADTTKHVKKARKS